MNRRVALAGEVKSNGRSRSESESEMGVLESDGADPKPGDLPMSRVKVR